MQPRHALLFLLLLAHASADAALAKSGSHPSILVGAAAAQAGLAAVWLVLGPGGLLARFTVLGAILGMLAILAAATIAPLLQMVTLSAVASLAFRAQGGRLIQAEANHEKPGGEMRQFQLATLFTLTTAAALLLSAGRIWMTWAAHASRPDLSLPAFELVVLIACLRIGIYCPRPTLAAVICVALLSTAAVGLGQRCHMLATDAQTALGAEAVWVLASALVLRVAGYQLSQRAEEARLKVNMRWPKPGAVLNSVGRLPSGSPKQTL